MSAQDNLWTRYPTVEKGVSFLPEGLKGLLVKHEASELCADWLRNKHPTTDFRNTAGEAVFHWDMVGMFFATAGRYFEALSIHRQLYALMCEAQQDYGWVHKGLPLVRLRDWHRLLKHPWHAERYLLLTLVEDAIREKGLVTPAASGVYHRFHWEDCLFGRSGSV